MPKASRGKRTAPPALSATYLYALFQGRAAAGTFPPGVPGAGPVRLLDAGRGLWLAAAHAPLSRFSKEGIERGLLHDLRWVSACALGHHRVVEHVGARGTVVPMKLFTLFTSDASALRHVAQTRKRIDPILKRMAGRQEWSIRLSPKDAHARAVPRSHRAEAASLFDQMAGLAEESRRRATREGDPPSLLLDAAYLVAAKRRTAFRQMARRQARRLLALGLTLEVSGPGPAYDFVSG